MSLEITPEMLAKAREGHTCGLPHPDITPQMIESLNTMLRSMLAVHDTVLAIKHKQTRLIAADKLPDLLEAACEGRRAGMCPNCYVAAVINAVPLMRLLHKRAWEACQILMAEKQGRPHG